METLQFILIGLLIASNVLLFFKSYYLLKINKMLAEADDNLYENIKQQNTRIEGLFNTINTQVTSNDEFRKELMNDFENFISDFKVYKKVHDLVSDRHSKDIEAIQSRFDKVETKQKYMISLNTFERYFKEQAVLFNEDINKLNKQFENYTIANDIEIAKIMEKVNATEEEQVELSHSFETMLTSLADVKTAEFLDNLGFNHEAE